MTIEGTSEVSTGSSQEITSPSTETPAGDIASKEETSGGAPPAAPAYQPNYKFNYHALDKGPTEAEFDEWAKAAVKDAETEKKVRDLYTKAHGLDTVKTRASKLEESNGQLNAQIEKTNQSLTLLGRFVQEKDYDSFFDSLKIPKEDILRYALQLVQLEQNPAQRQQFESDKALRQRAYQLELQNQHLSRSYETQTVQARTQALDSFLTQPQVSELARTIDSRMGRHGAFRDEVIKRGQYHAVVNGTDIPVEQAVQEVLALGGLSPQTAQSPGQFGGVGGTATPSQQQQAKPVLPNIQGRGTSPAKKVPKSIADLKKRAAELEAANQ